MVKLQLLVMLVCAWSLSPALAASAPVILDAARQALGGDVLAQAKTRHIRFTLTTSGLTGSGEIWIDLVTGRHRTEFDLGALSGADGRDEDGPWSRDSGGQTRRDRGGDAVLAAMNQAFRFRLGPFLSDRRQARLVVRGQQILDGEAYDRVELTPRGGRAFTYWFDHRSHLPARMIEAGAGGTRIEVYEDYRPACGGQMPFRIRRLGGEESRYDLVAQVISVECDGPITPDRFMPPLHPPADYSFPAAVDRVTIPFQLQNNHIWIEGQVNGLGPLAFLFDTGAEAVLADDVAHRLNLARQGEVAGTGVGEARQDLALTRPDSLSLGGITLFRPVCATTDFSGLAMVEGRAPDGLIGYEFARRFVTEIDYAAGRLTFFKPGAAVPPADAIGLPFHFNDHLPELDGSIDGLRGRFEIDTGSRSGLDLLAPFVRDHQLVQRYHAHRRAITGWGIGGADYSLLAPGRPFILGDGAGGVDVPVDVLNLSQQRHGLFANGDQAGIIGGAVLKQFTVTLDYERQRIWFRRNQRWGQPDAPDHSGLWLNQQGAALVVAEVLPDSPAEAAGIRPGNRILALDGEAVSGLGLAAIRSRLRGPVGQKLTLTIEKQGMIVNIPVILANLV